MMLFSYFSNIAMSCIISMTTRTYWFNTILSIRRSGSAAPHNN